MNTLVDFAEATTELHRHAKAAEQYERDKKYKEALKELWECKKWLCLAELSLEGK